MSTGQPAGSGTGNRARRSAWRRLLRDPQAVITASILLTIVILGLIGPLIRAHDPNYASLTVASDPPGTPGYLLGADQSGRDIAARLLASINTSMLSGLIGAGVAVFTGTALGLIGGYFGTRTRVATEWLFNLLMTFPGVLVLIILMPVTNGDVSVSMAFFGITLSPAIYRIVRNLVVAVKQELFVDAARVSGLSSLRILARHVLFVIRGPVIIASAFMFNAAIGVQAGLAFLGLGSSQTPSFGSMISDGFDVLYQTPVQFVWPSIALGLITASLVLLGNSLRDALEGARPRPARVPQADRQAEKAAARERPAASAGTRAPLLSVTDLGVAYPGPGGEPREVVCGISLELREKEVVGLVGESGSGKTQAAFAVLGVLPGEAAVTRGSVRLDGTELIGRGEKGMRALRGRQIAYIPQEPMSNLDPSCTVGSQLAESVRATSRLSRREARDHVLALLDRVGITDPGRTFRSYSHQISGGMAQRVLIAGAVASRPKLLIADEPTTALDVTVQAEILDLLRDLQQELGMAVLLITHNLGVVADVCERMAVMQHGQIVEAGPTLDVFRDPQHEYTRMLLSSILDEDDVRTDAPGAASRQESAS